MAISPIPTAQLLALTVAEPPAPTAAFATAQATQQAGAKIGQTIATVQGEHDALWVAEQMGQARTHWQRDLIQRQQGAAEEPTGFAQEATTAYGQWSAELLKRAPTAQARDALQKQLAGSIAPWVSGQAETFEATRVMQSRERRLDRVIGETANGLFQDPSRLPAALSEIEATIEAMTLPADRKAEVLQRARNAFATQALKGVVETDPDAGAAAAKEGRLFGVDLNPLLRIGDTGSGNLASLHDQAQSEIKRRQAMALAAAREAKAEARGELAGLMDNDLVSRRETGRGIEIPDALFKSAGLPQSRVDLYRDRQRIAGELFHATTTMAMATPDEVTALMQRPPAEGADAKGQAAVRDAAVKVITERQQAIAAGDAVDWVKRHDPNVRAGFDEVRTVAADSARAGEVPGLLDRAFSRAVEAQRRIGVDESRLAIIGKSNAQAYVAGLDPLKPLESAASLQQTLASYPAWARPMVLRELNAAKLPGWMVTMGEISDPAARQRLAQAAAIGPQRLTADAQAIGKDTPTQIREQLGTAATDLIRTMYRAGGGAPGAAERMLDAATMIALHQAAQGRSPSEAVRQAADDLWGRLAFTDTYTVPRELQSRVVPNAEAMKPKLLHLLSPLPTGDKRIDGTPEHEKMLKDVLGRSYWTNDADGRSLVLRTPNGEMWLKRDGSPMRMSFDELAQDAYDMPRRAGTSAGPLGVSRQMRREFDDANPDLVSGKAPTARSGPRDPQAPPAPGTIDRPTLPPFMTPPTSVAPGRPSYQVPPRPAPAPTGRDTRR